jgi:formyltetrahydrofolate hydrolase
MEERDRRSSAAPPPARQGATPHVARLLSTRSCGSAATSSAAVLARAVQRHLEDRVLVHENRTVVF